MNRVDLEHISTPTLVIGVENDRFDTYPAARYTAEHIPGARLVGYPDGGHVWAGHQAEVIAEIAKFLREDRGGSPRTTQ